MNTPSHHRVHHGSNRRYLDRNYAGVFIVWDRLFKTFTPENERVIYGLTKNIDTYNPLRVAFHEYAAIGRDLRAVSTFKDRYTDPLSVAASRRQRRTTLERELAHKRIRYSSWSQVPIGRARSPGLTARFPRPARRSNNAGRMSR